MSAHCGARSPGARWPGGRGGRRCGRLLASRAHPRPSRPRHPRRRARGYSRPGSRAPTGRTLDDLEGVSMPVSSSMRSTDPAGCSMTSRAPHARARASAAASACIPLESMKSSSRRSTITLRAPSGPVRRHETQARPPCRVRRRARSASRRRLRRDTRQLIIWEGNRTTRSPRKLDAISKVGPHCPPCADLADPCPSRR